MKRADILHTAEKCVCGQREQDYGSPENNFQTIADFWSVYKGVKFSASDVAMMMALLKVARIKSGGGTEDSFVDLAGYAACGGELVTEIPLEVAATASNTKLDTSIDRLANDTEVDIPAKVIDQAVQRAVEALNATSA